MTTGSYDNEGVAERRAQKALTEKVGVSLVGRAATSSGALGSGASECAGTCAAGVTAIRSTPEHAEAHSWPGDRLRRPAARRSGTGLPRSIGLRRRPVRVRSASAPSAGLLRLATKTRH
jgi:hypothetical protein